MKTYHKYVNIFCKYIELIYVCTIKFNFHECNN